MPFNVGPMELIIVMIIALIVIGPKKLPNAARSLGDGMKQFKDALTEGGRDKDEKDEARIGA